MDNNFQYITPDEQFLITILNTMYNENIRQINRLTNNNNDIMGTIMRLLSLMNNNSSRGIIIDNSIHPFHTRSHQVRPNEVRPNEVRPNEVRPPVRQDIRPEQVTSNEQIYDTQRNENNSLTRVYINRTPYILENVRNYRIAVNNDDTIVEERETDFLENFLNPVDIFPTSSQIESATRIVQYSAISRPNNTICPISLEPFREDDYVSVIRFCNHIFNTNEINSWFRRNCRCPVCRYDIRTYNPNNTLRQDSFPETPDTQEQQPEINSNVSPPNSEENYQSLPLLNILAEMISNNSPFIDGNGNGTSNSNTNNLINHPISLGRYDISGNYYNIFQ